MVKWPCMPRETLHGLRGAWRKAMAAFGLTLRVREHDRRRAMACSCAAEQQCSRSGKDGPACWRMPSHRGGCIAQVCKCASVHVCMCACVHVCAHSGKGGVSSKPCGSVAGAGRWLSGEAYRHAVRGKRQVDEEARLVPCLPGYSSRSGSTCIDHVVRRNLARARPLS